VRGGFRRRQHLCAGGECDHDQTRSDAVGAWGKAARVARPLDHDQRHDRCRQSYQWLARRSAGPASGALGCPGAAATNSGGGGGGGFGGAGGKGGEEGASPITTGGAVGNAISLLELRGGCDGGRGGDGSTTGGLPGVGGAGGGAVWISTDMGTLVIGTGAKINASGAGGARGLGSTGPDDGGAGGGSGGLIVSQAPAIILDPSAQIFANGGGGGGGAEAGKSGHEGSDPTGPSSGGGGGQGGSAAGLGGIGYFALGIGLDGADGDPAVHGGGGGGGGGAGAIRVASSTTISGTNVSPPPARLAP